MSEWNYDLDCIRKDYNYNIPVDWDREQIGYLLSVIDDMTKALENITKTPVVQHAPFSSYSNELHFANAILLKYKQRSPT